MPFLALDHIVGLGQQRSRTKPNGGWCREGEQGRQAKPRGSRELAPHPSGCPSPGVATGPLLSGQGSQRVIARKRHSVSCLVRALQPQHY